MPRRLLCVVLTVIAPTHLAVINVPVMRASDAMEHSAQVNAALTLLITRQSLSVTFPRN